MTLNRLSILVGALACLGANGCYLSAEPTREEPVVPTLPEFPRELGVEDPFVDFVDVQLVHVARERERREAILVFTGREATTHSLATMITWFDGELFSKPIPLGGFDHEDLELDAGLDVVFVDTSKFVGANDAATQAARARHGDAYVVYLARDAGDVPRVQLTHFDRTAVAEQTSLVSAGLARTAVPLDVSVPIRTDGADSTSRLRFVSDAFDGPYVATDPYAPETARIGYSGRATTSLALTHDQNLVTGSSIFMRAFDLGAASVIPSLVAAPDDGLLGADDGSSARPQYSAASIAYGACVFWHAADVDGVRATVIASCIDRTRTRSIAIGTSHEGAPGYTYLPSAIFGPPDGLAAFYVAIDESGFGSHGHGQRGSDLDSMLVRLAPDASSQAVVEVDAYRDPVDANDADHDGDFRRSGEGGASEAPKYALNRDGTFLFVATSQPSTDLTDADDGNPSIGRPASNHVTFLRVVELGRESSPLDDTVSAAVQAPASVASGDRRSGNASEPAGVLAFAFQSGSAAEAWQWDPARIHFTYEQLGDANEPDPNARGNLLYFNSILAKEGGSSRPKLGLANTGLGATRVPVLAPQPRNSAYAGTTILDRHSDSDSARVLYRTIDEYVELAEDQAPPPQMSLWDGRTHVRVDGLATAPLTWNEPPLPLGNAAQTSVASHLVWSFAETDASAVYGYSEAVLGRSLVAGAPTTTVPDLAEPSQTLSRIHVEAYYDEPPFAWRFVVAGDRVALIIHSGVSDVVAVPSTSDGSRLDASAAECLDCDEGSLVRYFVVPGRKDDTLTAAFLFVERPTPTSDATRTRLHVVR